MSQSPSRRYPAKTVEAGAMLGTDARAQMLLDLDQQASRVAQLLDDDRRAAQEEAQQGKSVRGMRSPSQGVPALTESRTGDGMLHPSHRPINRSSPISPHKHRSPAAEPSRQQERAAPSNQEGLSATGTVRAAGQAQALRMTSPVASPHSLMQDPGMGRPGVSPEDVQYARMRGLRQRLMAFYQFVAPEKLSKVDGIIEAFIARGSSPAAMDALNTELANTYGFDLEYQKRDKIPDYVPRAFIYSTQPAGQPSPSPAYVSRSPPPQLPEAQRLYASAGFAPTTVTPAAMAAAGSPMQALYSSQPTFIPPFQATSPYQSYAQAPLTSAMGSSPLQEMRAAERQHLESQLRAVQDREARLQNSIISAQNGGTGPTMSPNQQLGGLLVPKVGRYLPTTLLVGWF